MKSQRLLTVLFAAFLLSLAFVSADSGFTVSSPSTLTQSSNTTTFTITANNNVTISMPSPVSLNGVSVSISPTSFSLNASQTKTITLTTTSFPTVTNLMTYSGSFLVTNNATDNQTVTVTYNKGFCQYGAVNKNPNRYFEITNIDDKTSKTNWKWRPLDEVDVTAKVRFYSNDTDDSADGVLDIEVYDTQTNRVVSLLNSDDVIEDTFSLDEGKATSTTTYTIKLPTDIDTGSDRYKLYIKAYEDGKENSLCTDSFEGNFFQPLDVQRDSYNVTLKNIQVTDSVPCGQEAIVTADVYNLGAHDEDKIYVSLYNKELGIDSNSSMFSINSGDSDPYKLAFNIIVPNNATEKTYPLLMKVNYKYSDSSKLFREESDFNTNLKVSGSCSGSSGSSNITTVELSDQTPNAIIGNQLIVEATVKNTGTTSATYNVDVLGNSQWSNVETIDPKIFTLDAGESKKVSIYLTIDDNASTGEKEFTIRATSGSASSEQLVKINLEKGITSSAIINHFKNNWVIYTIVLVNLILIIAIILVVKSIVSSKD